MQQKSPSLNHLVGGYQQLIGHCEPEHLRGLAIDGKRELGRQLDRQVGGLSAVKYPVDIACCPSKLIDDINAIVDQTALGGR